MQLLPFAVILAGFSNLAAAHYRFAWFNGGAEYENIRKNTNYNSPIEQLSSNDLRCNAGGLDGSSTGVLNLNAGASLTFKLDTPVYHQGPVQWYLGKAPGDVKSWDGSGANWFKFHAEGPTFSGGQANWPMRDTYTATLPSSIPAGQYLVRIEQLGLHNPGAAPQFYISCAQGMLSPPCDGQ